MKTLACKDMGMADCDFVARGETEEEVMAEISAHARDVHGKETISDEEANKARSMMKEE